MEMGVELNHTIIPATDKWESAKFLAEILALPAGPQWGPFVPIRVNNGVTLDYMDADDFGHHHYAFLVGDEEFDAALSRIRAAKIQFYADFNLKGRGEINHLYGGRGVYFHDPNGHLLELITRPYGASPEMWTAPTVGPHSG
jgi:catechol 2,3-dioxygenase-like lactoylglutathione lyase family enzyme